MTREKGRKNGFLAENQRTTVGTCPYPRGLCACRQRWGAAKAERWLARIIPPGPEGDAGRAWLDRLSELVDLLAERWNLVVDGVPQHGYPGLVAPVRRRTAVEGVARPDDGTAHEIAALAVWNGRGAVKLRKNEPALGVMLLEWLDSRQRAWAWILVRCVDYWLGALNVGLTS